MLNIRSNGSKILFKILLKNSSFFLLSVIVLNMKLAAILQVKANKAMIKGALSDLRQYFAKESPLKMMKNAFCFTLKALFVLKIFKILS